MSGTKSPRGLTRRSFLKTTGVVAGAATLGGSVGCSTGQDEGLNSLSTDCNPGQLASEGEIITLGACRPNCFAYCPLNVHVRDGNIVKTSMAEHANPYLNRICMRGLSHVQRIYDPERIQYPLKRVGERGSDEWERISWDEAIEEIAEKILEVQKTYGVQAFAMSSVSGNMGVVNGGVPGIAGLFKNITQATTIGPSVDNANTVGVNRVCGNAGLWNGNETTDMINAKTVVAWGCNMTDAQIHDWHILADAMENGTRLIVIDPTFTQLAAKADKWIPVRPASDAALTLSLMYVILDEEGHDVEYLTNHTVAPFFVKESDGKFVRMSDMGVAPAEGDPDPLTGEPTFIDPCAVWDESTKSFVAVDEAVSPVCRRSME